MKRLIPAPLLLLASCSLVYDFDQFRPDEEIIPPDATDPSALSLDSVAPSFVLEGSGCTVAETGCDEDSVGVPIVISGGSIVADSVTVNGFGFVDQVVAATASTDGTLLGFVLPIPVNTELGNGAEEILTISATQAGVTDMIELTVRGLDELDVDGFAALAGVGGVHRFSTITLAPAESVTLAITTEQPLQLHATSSIVVSEKVTIDALNLGGCSGGGDGQPGECPPRGGNVSANPRNGGGGGGNNLSGGAGSGGISGGSPTAARMLSPLGDATGGGGGAGTGGGLGQGNAGGSGAGALALTSLGPLTLRGRIVAAGENGTIGSSCGVGGLTPAGGGGGGAGGAVLLRAGSLLSIDDSLLPGAVRSIDVQGGSGGLANECPGGAGSAGLIRLDGVGVAAPLNVDFARAAAWNGGSTVIRGSSTQSISLAGSTGTAYFLRTNNVLDETPRSLAADDDTVSVELQPGLNQLCAQVTVDGNLGVPESLNCINVAYIP